MKLDFARMIAIGLPIVTALALVPQPAMQAGGHTAGRSSGGFDVSSIDKRIDPCIDFYQYACAGWLTKNPIPPDQSNWGRFDELQERNLSTLKEILEKAAVAGADRDEVTTRIGDYYASCMDEAKVEALGTHPLEPDLKMIARLESKGDLPTVLAQLHSIGVDAVFQVRAEQDFKDARSVIAAVDQSGLGLPDRDYYLRDDEHYAGLRKKYLEHVRNMFSLLGDAPDAAAQNAADVLALETELAKVSLERVKRRDPSNLYHKLGVSDLAKLTPSFDWQRYFSALEAPAFDSLNVAVPAYFEGMEALLKSTRPAVWRTYLRWHLVSAAGPFLSSAFVNEGFDFYGKTLAGAQELRPRWKRCARSTDHALGELLGQSFVRTSFGPEARQHTETLVQALERALEEDIRSLPWMTEATRREALVKLDRMRYKLGYPEKWRDYTGVRIDRGDLVGNARRSNTFEFHRQLGKIGKPIDRGEWYMTPPTVNAYYDGQMNDINFPAGILQPPFFDPAMDDAVNLGAIGSVIGHEFTHGFDDEGRKFDGDGNMRDWWQEADAKEFETRAGCFVEQYSVYSPLPDVKLNGTLTLGENTADNGGLRIAYMALKSLEAGRAASIDGYTSEQRLFLGFAQIWCDQSTDEDARMRAMTDPHSPGQYRVNGTVSNMSEFQEAFQCKAGDPMVSKTPCRVW